MSSTLSTTIFEPGDLVHVQFPHVERNVSVRRPALVIAYYEPGPVSPLLWVLMVTNAKRPDWIGDVSIPDAESQGLLIPSKVRTTKISTVEAGIARRIGRLDSTTWDRVRSIVRATLHESS